MEYIFLNILNQSLVASWLILAVILFRIVFPNVSKNLRCILWGLVGIRLICPFSIESVVSLIPSAKVVEPQIMYVKNPAIDSGILEINNLVNPVITETFQPNMADSANPLQVYVFIAAWIWMIGIVGLLVYTIGSYIRFRYLLRDAVWLEEKVEGISDTRMLKFIFQSDRISQPLVFGIFKPRIYIPFSLGKEGLASVIAHEKMHIQRKDFIWKPLAFLVTIVYWFHPLVWLAYVLFSKDIELACDERVIRDMDLEQRKSYSRALLNCSSPKKLKLTCPLAFGENNVKSRIKMVLCYHRPSKWMVWGACVVGLLISVFFMTNPASGGNEPVIEPSASGNKQSVTEPPTLVLQDSISSLLNLKYVDCAGGYSWDYLTDNPSESIHIEVDAEPPLCLVSDDCYVELKEYNKLEYVPYLISFETDFKESIEPDHITLTEYDISDINNVEAKGLQTTQITTSLLNLKSNRVYVLKAEWSDENVKENRCAGWAEYVFVTR